MNSPAAAYQTGYDSHIIRTPRDTEYEAFSRVTRMLRQSLAINDRTAEIEAVGKNNELWTILAADLAAAGNGLPDEVRAGLLSLARFSIRHGHAVLARRESTEALIDINMTIMKGLRSEVTA